MQLQAQIVNDNSEMSVTEATFHEFGIKKYETPSPFIGVKFVVSGFAVLMTLDPDEAQALALALMNAASPLYTMPVAGRA